MECTAGAVPIRFQLDPTRPWLRGVVRSAQVLLDRKQLGDVSFDADGKASVHISAASLARSLGSHRLVLKLDRDSVSCCACSTRFGFSAQLEAAALKYNHRSRAGAGFGRAAASGYQGRSGLSFMRVCRRCGGTVRRPPSTRTALCAQVRPCQRRARRHRRACALRCHPRAARTSSEKPSRSWSHGRVSRGCRVCRVAVRE